MELSLKDDKLKFLNTLSKAGIEFDVSLTDGFYTLTPGEVLEYLENPELLGARKHGVTLEHWLAWKNFVENPRCYAITRKGRPCKIDVYTVDVKAFMPGVSEYCHVHQQHT